MANAKANNTMVTKLRDQVAELKEKLKALKAENKQLKADHKAELKTLKTQNNDKLLLTAETAYEAGFSDALDELEAFTHARDEYLRQCEAVFENEYAAQLSASKKTKKTKQTKSAGRKKTTSKGKARKKAA